MSRPSLKKARSEEILDAFMRCIARYGLDGSTLERISNEAEIGRPLLRHYLGNRDQMVAKLLDHVAKKFEQMTEALFVSLPQENRLNALISQLFGQTQHLPESAAVFQALVAASDRHPDIKAILLNFVYGFERRITAEIMGEKPQANTELSKIAATGITAIYFNTDSISPLNPNESWLGYQQRAAQILLDGI